MCRLVGWSVGLAEEKFLALELASKQREIMSCAAAAAAKERKKEAEIDGGDDSLRGRIGGLMNKTRAERGRHSS